MNVVSLVPSATETLRALGVDPVACTRFCEQPDLPAVGGTKNPDVAAIVGLQPDLVVVNDEENRVEDADALAAAGLRLHSMSPRSVADVGPAVRDLAVAVGSEVQTPFGTDEWAAWLAAAPRLPSRRVAVLIWRRPWMTLNGDTYGSSLLAVLGLENVFGDAPDRYAPTTLEDVAALDPELVLLPSEPYSFSARHLGEIGRSRLIDGRDLFWWGIRTPLALERLHRELSS